VFDSHELYVYNIDPQTSRLIMTPCFNLIFNEGSRALADLSGRDLAAAHQKLLQELRSIEVMGAFMFLACGFCFKMNQILKCVKREECENRCDFLHVFFVFVFCTASHSKLTVGTVEVLLNQGLMHLGNDQLPPIFGLERPGVGLVPRSEAAKRHKPKRSSPPQRRRKRRRDDSSEEYQTEQEEEEEEEEEQKVRVRKKRRKRAEDAEVRIEN
jgi:hypothetical protein